MLYLIFLFFFPFWVSVLVQLIDSPRLVSEMTYYVLSGMLNSTATYGGICAS